MNNSLERIRKFRVAFEEFKQSAHNLAYAWNRLDDGESVEYNLVSALCDSKKYPLKDTFDSIVNGIEYWCGCFESAIAIAEREAMKRGNQR